MTALASAMKLGYRRISRLLIDAGASVELAGEMCRIPQWVHTFVAVRRNGAQSVVAFIGNLNFTQVLHHPLSMILVPW